MKSISTSQMREHGREAHLTISRRRNPMTIRNHSGRVLDEVAQDSVARGTDNIQS